MNCCYCGKEEDVNKFTNLKDKTTYYICKRCDELIINAFFGKPEPCKHHDIRNDDIHQIHYCENCEKEFDI